MSDRIYLVTRTMDNGDTEGRLVRAGTRSQAVRHVVNDLYSAHPAKAGDVAYWMGKGATVETAGEDDTE